MPAVNDFYDYRGFSMGLPDCPVERPFHQGDIFQGIEIPGVIYSGGNPEEKLAMLFLHPCTMRDGPLLVERVSMIAVKPHDILRGGNPGKGLWEKSHFSKLPLYDLRKDGILFTANFLELGTVPSSELNKEDRVACLSILGRSYFSQRIINHLTRFTPTLAELKSNTEIVEQDFEGQWDWVEAALTSQGLSSSQVTSVAQLTQLQKPIEEAEAEYAAIMNDPANRDRMKSDDLETVKILMQEIGQERLRRYGS